MHPTRRHSPLPVVALRRRKGDAINGIQRPDRARHRWISGIQAMSRQTALHWSRPGLTAAHQLELAVAPRRIRLRTTDNLLLRPTKAFHFLLNSRHDTWQLGCESCF